MNDFISINDELLIFKNKAKECGLVVSKIEKIGNQSMSAFKAYYKEPNNDEEKELFFWRHDLDTILTKLEEKYLK